MQKFRRKTTKGYMCPTCFKTLTLSFDITSECQDGPKVSYYGNQEDQIEGKMFDDEGDEFYIDTDPVVECSYCGSKMVIIDNQILDLVSRLNKAGLKTLYCCEGHYLELDLQPDILNMYIENKDDKVVCDENGFMSEKDRETAQEECNVPYEDFLTGHRSRFPILESSYIVFDPNNPIFEDQEVLDKLQKLFEAYKSTCIIGSRFKLFLGYTGRYQMGSEKKFEIAVSYRIDHLDTDFNVDKEHKESLEGPFKIIKANGVLMLHAVCNKLIEIVNSKAIKAE